MYKSCTMHMIYTCYIIHYMIICYTLYVCIIYYTLYNYNYICACQFEMAFAISLLLFFQKRLNISAINQFIYYFRFILFFSIFIRGDWSYWDNQFFRHLVPVSPFTKISQQGYLFPPSLIISHLFNHYVDPV